MRHVVTADQDAAAGSAAQPGDCLGEFALPVARYTAKPTISPARTSSEMPLQRGQILIVVGAQVAHRQLDLADADGGALNWNTTRPTIIRASFGGRG
ncbi:MAG: hypothetical protein U0521_29050 [Anaerolineae bacterium]